MKIINYFRERLREPSTYVGIATFVIAVATQGGITPSSLDALAVALGLITVKA